MAVQPMFVPLGEEERVVGWVKVGEWGELEEQEELECGAGASGGDTAYLREVWRIGDGLK